jgi:arginyl-tRNA--protein-N-Asp/Glu arginylyltransferase
MLSSNYLEKLKQSYRSFFDVYTDKKINDELFNIYAKSNIKNEKYLGTKSLKIWGYENNEHCLVKTYNNKIDEENIDELVHCLRGCINILVKPHLEHMLSVITCVVVTTEGYSEKAIRKAKKVKISRAFAFGFKGWCDVRLILVDLKHNAVYTNKKGREVINFYKPDRLLVS